MALLTPDQLAVSVVHDYLATADGPFHITAKAARALAELFAWHRNLDSDEPGDNEVIIAAAKAFDTESGCDTGPALLCVGCHIEQHLGKRDTVNPAAVVVNGTSSCLEHWQIVDGPVLPDRTAGGILLPGTGA